MITGLNHRRHEAIHDIRKLLVKIKYLATIIASFLLFAVVSAQPYSIRANRGLNLRAAPSLSADIAATVRMGAILNVVGHAGGWLKINRDGNEVWLADWVNFSRVNGSQETSSATGTTSEIDNCCFVDRECATDHQWVDGYWAYQNGHCATETSSQPMNPTTSETSVIDNCCFAGWLCRTDQEWQNGYFAYQYNQCGQGAPTGFVSSCCQSGWNCSTELDRWLGDKVIKEGFECDQPKQVAYGRTVIDGSETFIRQITASLEYLKARTPHWYAYIVNGVRKIRGGPWGPGTFAFQDSLNIAPPHAREATIVLAGTLLHEACHVNRIMEGSFFTTSGYDTVEGFSVEENICEVLREGALTEANPRRPTNPWLEAALAHYFNNGGQFDFQAAANGQRDRAFWLLSQGI